MTDDKIKEAFEEWWKRHQLKESSLDSDDAMYCFKYGYKAGLKEELQDKNNKFTKEDYRKLNGIYDGFQENMEQIEKPKPYILKSKES